MTDEADEAKRTLDALGEEVYTYDEASGLSCKACKVQNTLRFFSHGNVNKFYLVKCMNPACTWEWTRRRT